MSDRKPGRRGKTRWTQEFKLRALSLMEASRDVSALAAELGCGRELLYIWRRKYRLGGADALRPIGRPALASQALAVALPPRPEGSAAADQQRIAELERKIGQQQLDLDFFRAALRHVREQRRRNGEPGGTASSR